VTEARCPADGKLFFEYEENVIRIKCRGRCNCFWLIRLVDGKITVESEPPTTTT